MSQASTLDTFLRPPTPRRHHPSPSTSTSTSTEKLTKRKSTPSTRTKRATKRTKRPLAQDNRNLGTLDLVDSDDDDDDHDDLDPTRPSVHRREVDRKGKGKMALEEEDWMQQVDPPSRPAGPASTSARRRPSPRAIEGHDLAATCCDEPLPDVPPIERENEARDDVVIGTSDDEEREARRFLDRETKRLADPKTQDLKDGCEAEPEGVGTPPTTGRGHGPPAETIELSSDDDDLQVEGGLTCPTCKINIEPLPVKRRNSHIASCTAIPSPSTVNGPTDSADSKSFLRRGFLAPISRLFSRGAADPSPAPAASASAPRPPPTNKVDSSSPSSATSKPLTSTLPNAFTALMAGHAESTQWKEADVAAKQKGRMPRGEERKVPFYKWIDGMEVTVDAFKYGKIEGCKGYFLSHAHSDHYQNLSSSWNHGPIYCSLTTANLIKLKLKVDEKWVHPLPLDQTVKVQGIDVTLIDANHCPGSVLFLFEGPHTDPKSPYSKTPSRIFRHLHCGDFRASPQHILHPSMSFPTPSPYPSLLPACLRGRTPKKLDAVYLDTTYLSPAYCFPAQELVIEACADLVRERVVDGNEEALWRADGRDGERMGIKGWLSGNKVKDEGGGVLLEPVKGEHDDEDEDEDGQDERDDKPRVGRSRSGSMTTRVRQVEQDDGEEEWRMVRELESQGSAQGETPRETPAPSDGAFDPFDVPIEEGYDFEEVPTLPEDERDDDFAFKCDNVKREEREEEDADDVKPSLERGIDPVPDANTVKSEERGDLNLDNKPDVKPDVKPKTERLLVMVGTYSIGKERIVKAIAHALNTKIYADPRKKELFIAQDDPDLHSLLTDDPLEAQVHVGYLQNVQRDTMLEYLAKYKAPRVEGGFTKMIGLRPTGWTYRSESKDKFPSIPKILQLEQSRKFSPAGLYPQRDSTFQCMGFGVPYSEHSSFFELTCFCLSVDFVRIIPTVNVHTANSRNKMKEWIDRWAAEKKRRNDQRLPKVVPFRNENYW